MASYNVNSCTVENLLTYIKDGTLVIPEMQRPFVWNSAKVRDLIDSLYKGFPIGYIIECINPDIRLRIGLRVGSNANVKRILIDGQQRITALKAAIVGDTVIDSHFKSKRICISFNPLEQIFEVQNPAKVNDPNWISDISEIFSPDFSSYSFITDYCKKNNLSNENADKLSNVINRLINIKTYNIGIITLANNLQIDEITDIFIRINSKGVDLSQADYAMSKIASNLDYKGNIIRKCIDYFCHLINEPNDFEYIKDNDIEFSNTVEFNSIKWIKNKNNLVYKPDYTDLLRVAFTSEFYRGKLSDLVSLLSGRDFEARDYKKDIKENSYNKLLEGVKNFVNKNNFERYIMILNSIGIVNENLVRSKNSLNFGYILMLALRKNNISSNIIEKIVRKWLVLSMLTSRYSGSPESTFDYDIKKFINSNDPFDYLQEVEAYVLSEAFWENEIIAKLNTSVSSNPIYKIFLMAQSKANDNGFLSDCVSIKSMLENRGDVHHLFPKDYLKKNNFKRGDYNQIANYVYLQTEINNSIKNNSPKIYMNEIKNQCNTKIIKYGNITSEDKLKENLKQNCIPLEFIDMDKNDYYDFLENRRKLMAKKIKDYYYSL